MLPPPESSTPETTWRSPTGQAWHQGLLVIWVMAVLAQAASLVLRLPTNAVWHWMEVGFLPLTALSCLAGLARRLPGQNVVMVGFVVAGLASMVLLLAGHTGIPFGPLRFTEVLGYRLLEMVPWPLPFLWIGVVVMCRGVARLIVRPYRKTTYYGFWVLGIATVLAVLFDLSLEPYATGAKGWWEWGKFLGAAAWYGTPWVNSLGWLVAHGVILAFATPWFLNKQPVRQPTDLHPLVIWGGWHLLFALAHGHDGRWAALVATLLVGGGVAVMALRGVRS